MHAYEEQKLRVSFEKHEDDFAKISQETLLTVEVIQMWCDR